MLLGCTEPKSKVKLGVIGIQVKLGNMMSYNIAQGEMYNEYRIGLRTDLCGTPN